METYDVYINDSTNSVEKWFNESFNYSTSYIGSYDGSNESYSEVYKEGSFSVVCDATRR